jgi:hypothetical protein
MKLPLERHTVEELFDIDSEINSLEVCMDYDVKELEQTYKDLEKKLKDRQDTSIGWSVEDFIHRAFELENLSDENTYSDLTIENAKKYLEKYDPDKFEDALYDMIRHHDAEIGITWDTVDCYLDEYCLKDKK